MAKFPRDCPECHTPLGKARVLKTGNVRCSECDFVIAPVREDDDSGARIQAKPGPARTAAKPPVKKQRREEDDSPPVRKGNGLLIGLVCGGVALGLLLLLCAGGGAAMYFTRSQQANVAAQQLAPTQQVMAQAPVGKPNPGPANGGPPPVVPQPPKDPIKADGGALPLAELKAASVYVKARSGDLGSSGSGFVFRAQGDAVYVVTNHHVVTPPDVRIIGPGRPFRGFVAPFSEFTVVFRSGTPQEQSLKAVLVGDDKDADLAVLKVTGVNDPPRPIDCTQTPKLVETMTVLAFGFPFGAALDPKQKNPAITVTKGTVSSLRLNGEELSDVQLSLDLNPGNSGGPVVDEKGTLIGVAVAKIKNSNIGYAIPVHKLDRLMEGRVEPPGPVTTSTTQGQTQVRAIARVSDPLGKLRNLTLLYGPADELKPPTRGKDGWEMLAGAKSSPLKIEAAVAATVLALTPPTKGSLNILAQVSYENGSGRTVYTEPRTLTVAAPGTNAPPVGPNPTVPAAPEDLTGMLADLKGADEGARLRAASLLALRPPAERRAEFKQALQPLLTSTDELTRAAAVRALAACDPKDAPAALVKLLDDSSFLVRTAVFDVLKERPDVQYAGVVVARLSGTDAIFASEVLKAMGPAAEPTVVPLLKSRDSQVRFQVYLILKEIGSAASVTPLNEALRANPVEGPLVRSALTSVRERVPLTKEEWPAALEDLKSADATRRTYAVRRVAATPPVAERRADLVPRLESLLNDQSAEARAAAAKALGRWAGKDAVPTLVKRLDGFDPTMHAETMDALAETKDEAGVKAIAKRLTDIHDRAKASKVLRTLDAGVVEKAVLPLLTSTDWMTRTEVCKVLGEVGGRDSIEPLEKLAKENDFMSGPATAQALATVKERVGGGDK